MKKILSLFVLMLMATCLFAQTVKISGTVKDSEGEPIIGAVVMERGANNGTIADIDGKFTLDVQRGASLECSMIGYLAQRVTLIDNQTVYNFVLQEDTKNLDEVVVIGYGTAKKSDLTSSISSVSSDDIVSFNSGNAMNALQSKVNGVQISNTGVPGSNPRVIIRGVTTVNGSNPLYVVDGMPVGDNINFLNPEDIESMEVLKDASASAIYGTRASNGVIIITTKKGKAGQTTFQFSSSVGVSLIDDPKMAKASEYEKVYKTRYSNDNQVAPYNGIENISDAEGTDWWNETVKQYAISQNYNLSFQGGNDKMVYSGSFGYYRAESHYNYGYWEKFTGRINTEYTFNSHVKFGVELAPKLERWDDTPNLMGAAMAMDPTTPIFRADYQSIDNEYSWYARSNNNQEWNPVASLSRMTAHSNEYGLLMNPYIDIEFIKGLSFKSQFGDNARFRMSDNYSPNFFIDNLEKADVNQASRGSRIWNDWNWTNTLNYQTTFAGAHNLNGMAGYTMEKFNYYWLDGSREGIPSNNANLHYVAAGTENERANGSDSFSTLLSYLGRVMYNYDSRYYLTASIRCDGSSKFPDGNKYAIFPAVSGAWRITGENFMMGQTIFSNLKLRLGWGRVGNQSIDNSAYLSTIGTSYYVVNDALVTGSFVSSTANTDIRWETVEDYNLGLDMGFFNNRLTTTVELYKKITSDMLLKEDNLNILGYPEWAGAIWTNVGSMEATGWEVSVNWKDQSRKDLSYEVGVNLSGVKNIAKDLGKSSPILTGGFNGDYIIRNESDAEISKFWGYQTNGIFQNWTDVTSYTSEHGDPLQPKAQPGDLKFVDRNHDGIIDEQDKWWLGSGFPNIYLGVNLGVNYKNWDLSMNFYGIFGNSIYNKTKGYYSGVSGQNVWEGTYEDAWHYDGQSTDIPRLSYNDANQNYTTVSDWFIEDGSYLRCKQIQLGYTISKEALRIGTLRLSLSAQNPFIITKYSGFDPETATTGSVTETGIDGVAYPNTRIFLFGVNLNF